jgi:two-component system LytT family sensor kinase
MFRIAVIAIPLLLKLAGILSEPVISGKHILSFFIFLAGLIAVCEGSRTIIYKGRKWFLPEQKLKRRAAIFSAGVFTVSLSLIISRCLRNYAMWGEWRFWQNTSASFYLNDVNLTVGILGSSIFYGIVVFSLLYIIYELFYHFARLKYMEQEKEQLEKQKLQAELQQLKGIVNPHFLFNNLNSLSSLISENPPQAEIFLDELTKVFRYLLRNNNTELVTVAQELQFLRSYFQLLHMRFGEGISLNIDTNTDLENYLLPPLTLQLLMENAVKHNQIHRGNPLQIKVYTRPGQQLVISNNLRPKDTMVESTGIGIQSINARYRMLNREGLTITKTEEDFTVIIPLLLPTISSAATQQASALMV